MADEDKQVQAGAMRESWGEFDERIDAAFSSVAKANAAGIAACLVGVFKADVDITFPLGCFLIAALGYGLKMFGEILTYSDVFIDQVRLGWKHSPNWARQKLGAEPSPSDAERWFTAGIFLEFIGMHMLVGFFLVGVIAAFVIVAF
jgi:hypothetical protein